VQKKEKEAAVAETDVREEEASAHPHVEVLQAVSEVLLEENLVDLNHALEVALKESRLKDLADLSHLQVRTLLFIKLVNGLHKPEILK